MPNPAEREETLFLAAREIPDPARRAAFLAKACGTDAALRERIECLLTADGPAQQLWNDDPASPGDATTGIPEDLRLAEGPGSVIGRYKLLEQIGHGGMGVVYMAEQEAPVRRRVALKIIKLGMDTRSVVARFEAERQALALMDHPNIAKVFDAGSTDTGRPFFVMELVRGIPITEFCDRKKLSTQERLGLFIPVCQAIQHAHQKGIIHRDIKPTNVLVALFDGRPVPMVIDFGVAKATNQRLTEKTLFTHFAQLVGTPAYMSPEQAEGSQLDIDTRSDIYSLGVLLYELLTGTTPFSEKRLRSLGYAEMQRVIAEEEPPRPSTRLTTLTDIERNELAKRRSEDLRSLTLLFRNELDWVVMKALEKHRTRRYETANGLAMDVQRYLDGRPIEAAPPTWGYQFYKLARKHKKTFAAAALMAVLLTGAALFSTWQAIRATKAERIAEARAEEVQRERATTEAINRWLTEDLLTQSHAGSAHGGQERGPNLTLADAILAASATLSDRFKDQPAIEGNLQVVVGRTLEGLVRHEDAVNHFQKAYDVLLSTLGNTHTNTLDAQFALGWALAWINSGQTVGERKQLLDKGRRLMEESYRTGLQLLGPEHRAILQGGLSLGIHYVNANDLRLAEAIVPQTAEIVARVSQGDDREFSVLRYDAQRALAWLRQRQGRLAEARAGYEQLWEMVTVSHKGATALSSVTQADLLDTLGSFYWSLDRDFDRARQAHSRGLDISQRAAGDGYPTQNLLGSLTALHLEQRMFGAALEFLRQSHDINVRRLGHAHPWTRRTGRQIAALAARLGDWKGAADELQAQREQDTTDALSFSQELLARTLAGQSDGLAALRREFWKAFQEQPAESGAYFAALTLLTLPAPELELPQVMEFAECAESDLGDQFYWVHLRKPALHGMSAHRRGQFAKAIGILEPVARDRSNRRLVALARCFLAMALHQEGRDAEARVMLEQARELLDHLLQPGDLQLPFPGGESWNTLACAILARNEAERLILGRTMSKPVTKDSLAPAREQWQPVRVLLDQSNIAARRRDYVAARGSYLRARQHPAFALESAMQEVDWLVERLPVVFALAGDQEGFETFLQESWRDDADLTANDLFPVACRQWPLAPELWDRFLTRIAFFVEKLSDVSLIPEGSRHWAFRHIGATLYGAERFSEALPQLVNATASPNHDCSTSAKAYAALAAWKLGRTDEARKWRAEAEEAFRIRVEAGRGRLDPVWWHLAATELALREARKLMDD